LDAALERAHGVAEVLEVIARLRELALAGDTRAAKEYLDRTIGPVRSYDDERRIEERAEDLIDHMIAKERARRAAIADQEGDERRLSNASDGGMKPTPI
jgi:hypothetical protein